MQRFICTFLPELHVWSSSSFQPQLNFFMQACIRIYFRFPCSNHGLESEETSSSQYCDIKPSTLHKPPNTEVQMLFLSEDRSGPTVVSINIEINQD
ncbi:hypothetical protein CDAR_528931 [Caerostris darwini]|uniref:Uncharacterized protein n=1 Tax=Caerostris darwini TaxID=1538125 RepID=A0AAV4UCU0_9ARAC|nr:hypothetical protein CDAR_528931 [Caerostris darwini]